MHRRGTWARASVLAAATMVAATGAAAVARAGDVVASGSFHCADHGQTRPLEGAMVEVIHAHDGLFGNDATIGIGHTGPQGAFTIAGHLDGANPNVYVRVWLMDEPRKVILHNEISNVATYNTRVEIHPGVQGNVDIGAWQIGEGTDAASVQCLVWDSAYRAHTDYVSLMGAELPAGRYHVQHYTVWDEGVPWTDIGTTHWPVHYPVRDPGFAGNSVFHEFGHSIRHAADGDRAHFDADVLAYSYGIGGWCGGGTSGNAFNEGWAGFWDWTLSQAPNLTAGCSEDAALNRVGNVARALRRLSECAMKAGGTAGRARLVSVLLQSRGLIHSYERFEERFMEIFGGGIQTCGPPLGTGSARDGGLIALGDRDLQSAVIAKAVADLDAVRADLRLREVQATAEPIPPCLAEDCAGALAGVLAPIRLQGEIDLADLARSRVRREIVEIQPARPPRRLHEFGALRALRSFDDDQPEYDRAVADTAAGTLERALDAIAPLRTVSTQAEQAAQELANARAALAQYVSLHGAAPPGSQPRTSPAGALLVRLPVVPCPPDAECLPSSGPD